MKSVKKIAWAAAVAAMLVAAPAAFAQQPSCADFQRLPDGKWAPTRSIRMTGPNGIITLNPGSAFGPGSRFMDVDLFGWLEANCPH